MRDYSGWILYFVLAIVFLPMLAMVAVEAAADRNVTGVEEVNETYAVTQATFEPEHNEMGFNGFMFYSINSPDSWDVVIDNGHDRIWYFEKYYYDALKDRKTVTARVRYTHYNNSMLGRTWNSTGRYVMRLYL
jgi:hypothetical protein